MMYYTEDASRVEITQKDMDNFIRRHSKIPLNEENHNTNSFKKILTPFNSMYYRMQDKEMNTINQLMETKRMNCEIEEKFQEVFDTIKPINKNKASYNIPLEQNEECLIMKDKKRAISMSTNNRNIVPVKEEINKLKGSPNKSYRSSIARHEIKSVRSDTLSKLSCQNSINQSEKRSAKSNVSEMNQPIKTKGKYGKPNLVKACAQPINKKPAKEEYVQGIKQRKWNEVKNETNDNNSGVKSHKYMDVFAKERIELAKQLQKKTKRTKV